LCGFGGVAVDQGERPLKIMLVQRFMQCRQIEACLGPKWRKVIVNSFGAGGGIGPVKTQFKDSQELSSENRLSYNALTLEASSE
jgi:hypothetical protein